MLSNLSTITYSLHMNLLSVQKLLYCEVGPQSFQEIFMFRLNITYIFCRYSVTIRHLTSFLHDNKRISIIFFPKFLCFF